MAIDYMTALHPIPPGELLEEDLAERGIPMRDAAAAFELSIDDLLALLRGDLELTPTIAERIEAFLGSKAYIWLRLEQNYRAALAKEAEERALSVREDGADYRA